MSYGLGRWLGKRSLPAFLKTRLEKLNRRLAKRGILAVALLRLVPTAPFPVINFAAGTAGIRFSDYLVGTGLGMLPGIVLVVLSADLIRKLLAGPDPLVVAGLAAVLVLAVLVVIVIRRRVSKQREGSRAA